MHIHTHIHKHTHTHTHTQTHIVYFEMLYKLKCVHIIIIMWQRYPIEHGQFFFNIPFERTEKIIFSYRITLYVIYILYNYTTNCYLHNLHINILLYYVFVKDKQ